MNYLNDPDRRILRAMQQNCTRTTAELADLVGLSQPACWRRLQRLRDEGYIVRETAVLDREKLGFGTQVYALVKLSNVGRANLSGFADAIRALPEVVECHVLMGAADFLLKIVTKDIHAYERFFFDSLSALDGIQDVTSSVALSEIKTSIGLPI
jgi:Lrp/AsnC family transcriptional regulator, cysteine-sensing transcriptional activator